MKYIDLTKYEYVPGITSSKEFKVFMVKANIYMRMFCLIFVISLWQTTKTSNPENNAEEIGSYLSAMSMIHMRRIHFSKTVMKNLF